MSILEELYNGNITPSEKYLKKGGEYQRLNEKVTADIDRLLELLNDEERELLKGIGENISNLTYISEKESFIEGFRMGSQMMWEAAHYESPNYSY